MNETSAKEWLKKAWHDLSGATVLFEANHYTDTIAYQIHFSCEKILKSILAYQNKKIPKIHDLLELYKIVNDKINLDDDLILLKQLTQYRIKEAYPTFDRTLPSTSEVKEALDFTHNLFNNVCQVLNIDKKSLL